MTTAAATIGRTLRHPPGTLVHVGAANGAMIDDYASLRPARLLLADGDADAVDALRTRTAQRPRTEVHEVVVARRSMTVHWYHFNLPRLNGPVDRSDLVRFYPRLRLLQTQSKQAVAFSRWLEDAVGTLDAGRSHVLVLDLPGQEDALLGSLPPEMVQRFEVVAVRSCAQALPGASTPQAVATRLREAGFRAVHVDDVAQDPLWPMGVWAFDGEAAAARALRDRCVRLEERLAAVESMGRFAEVELAARLAIDALAARIDEQAQVLAAHLQRLDTLQAGEEAARRMSGMVDKQAQALAVERARWDTLHAEQRRLSEQQVTLDAELQSTRVAVRAVALHDRDLEELQARHGRLTQEHRETVALLARVTDSLSALSLPGAAPPAGSAKGKG